MSTGRYPRWQPGIELREDWLAQVQEDIIEPDRDIVDPHHHLWHHGDAVYECDALRADTGSGHKIVQTVYVECRSYYDQSAAPHLQSVGETKHVAQLATAGQTGRARIAGIIAHADLRRDDLDAILDTHEEAGQGLLVGIRHSGACDPDPDALLIPGRAPPGLYADPEFRRGLARLGARGLTYDTWHYHHQAAEFLDLARAVPGTTLVLDHFGTPLGVGRFAGQRERIFDRWTTDMQALSDCPNVVAKLGGLSMPDNGWGWDRQDTPPTSDQMVAAQGDWYRHMIACFGAHRCMFESNFPVDRTAISYPVLWNAFKKIAAGYDEAEKNALFSETARRTYGL